jgi:prepilin peptidase CpaA
LDGVARLVLLAAFCLAAVTFDLKAGRIPNRLNALGCAAGFAVACVSAGASGAASSAAGALLGLVILLAPFLLRMVGGGDVKFLAAAGAIVGWRTLWFSFLAGALMGGIFGIALWLFRDRSLARLKERVVLLRAGCVRKPGGAGGGGSRVVLMPYALPLSVGLLLVSSIRTLS